MMASPARKETDSMLKQLESKLKDAYTDGLKTAYGKFTDYMNGISDREKPMQDALDAGKISQNEFNSWKLNQLGVGQRWADMCSTLSTDLTNTNKIAMNMVGDHMNDVYATNYNYQTYKGETAANIDSSFTLYNHDTVENLVKNNPDLLPSFTVDEEKDDAWNKSRFNSVITSGILAGLSNQDIARNISGVYGSSKSAAIRSARTATTCAETSGQLDSMQRLKDMGVKIKKQWMATLDDRTRDSHRELDGETQDLDDEFSNGLQYPGDPMGDPSEVYNCRCTLISLIDDTPDVDFSDTSGRVSNLGGQSYEEWKNGRDTPPTNDDDED